MIRAKYTEQNECELTAFNNIDYNVNYLEFNLSNVIHENTINKDYFNNEVNLEDLIKDETIYQSW